MRITRPGRQHGFSRLAIGFLIASVVHVPLPQADFHNVRHHDAPGELCPLHDHLLSWHPTADVNDDIALLHWHWFVPLEEMGSHSSPRDGHHGVGQGPAMHAQAGDQPCFDWCFESAYESADGSRLAPDSPSAPWDLAAGDHAGIPIPTSTSHRPTLLGSLRARVVTAILARLNC